MLWKLTTVKYNNLCIKICFIVLIITSIHTWWYIYKTNKSSYFVRSLFGIRSSECTVQYPENSSLVFRNTYWQVLNTSKCSVFIFGAYLDVRNENNPLVKFTTMFDKLEPKVRLYAQIWYNANDRRVSVTPKCEFRVMWHLKWGSKSLEYPFLVSCNIQQTFDWKLIESASLVENICNIAENRIAIRQSELNSTVQEFGVCVKGLNIPDEKRTIRLIEWIEMIHLLGAHKIYFYELNIHPQLKKLLEYYTRKKKVDVVPIRLSSPNQRFNLLAKRHNEMIVYNDCFYRHHAKYKYLVLLDIDEVIVPTTVSNWQALFATLSTRFKSGMFQTINSICVRNIYFLDEFRRTKKWFQGIPEHMHMLQHIYRQKNFSRIGFYTKCFHSTAKTVILHNHFAFTCERKCLYHHLDVKLAQLNHYRTNCNDCSTRDCDRMKKRVVMDFGMWSFKDKLIENVGRVISDMNLNSSVISS